MAVGEGTLSSLLEQLYKDYRGIETQRGERYQAGLGELAEAAGLFGPGYGVGMEREALAGAKQSLIGRGLGGTTRPMAVSAGMKAQFEDLRRGRLAEALGQMAGYRRTFPEGTATAGILSHLATGGFGGAMQERGIGLQERQMGMTERAEAEARKGPSPWEAGFMGGGWTLGGAGGGGGYTVPSSAYDVGRIGGAVARAGGTTETTEPIQWAALEKGLPEGYRMTETGVEPVRAAHAQSFQDYFNYSSELYKKTGEKLSQREAYAKLKNIGWTG